MTAAASSPACSAFAVRPAARSGCIRVVTAVHASSGDALAHSPVRVDRGAPFDAACENQNRPAATRPEQLLLQEKRLRLTTNFGVRAQRFEEEAGEPGEESRGERGGCPGAKHHDQREQHAGRRRPAAAKFVEDDDTKAG